MGFSFKSREIFKYREISEEKSTKEQKGISVSVQCQKEDEVITPRANGGLWRCARSKDHPRLP